MHRRAFLASVAGFIAARFAPALPKPPCDYSGLQIRREEAAMVVRCVSHYDAITDHIIIRFDVACGWSSLGNDFEFATRDTGRCTSIKGYGLLHIDQNQVIRKMLADARV